MENKYNILVLIPVLDLPESYIFESRFNPSIFCSPTFNGYQIAVISTYCTSRDLKYLRKLGALNMSSVNFNLNGIDQEKYDFLYKYYLESVLKNSL